MRVGRWAGGALIAANAAVVALLWAGGIEQLGGAADGLVALARFSGLLGAYVALLALLLVGLGRLDRVGTRSLGRWCVSACWSPTPS